MGLETGTSVAALNANWPLGSDPKAQGDDHLRLIKSVMQADVLSLADGGEVAGPVRFLEGLSASKAVQLDNNTSVSGQKTDASRVPLAILDALDRIVLGNWTEEGQWRGSTLWAQLGGGGGIGFRVAPGSVEVGAGKYLITSNVGAGSDDVADFSVGSTTGCRLSDDGMMLKAAGADPNNKPVMVVRKGPSGSNWTLQADGSVVGPSDGKLKRDVEPIAGALDKVLRLMPVRFRWKDGADDAPLRMGLIAQEVRPVAPELVSERDGVLELEPAPLLFLALAAIRELAARLERAEAGLAELGGRDG